MGAMNIPTLVDCGCKAIVWEDGSGVEIEYCDMHYAAPDLLAACERYFNRMTGVHPHNYAPGWYCDYCNAKSQYPSEFQHEDTCPVQQALNAIAKARGE